MTATTTSSNSGPNGDINKLKRAVKYSNPPKASVASIFTLSLIISGLAVAEPLIIKFFFDNLENFNSELGAMAKAISGLIIIALLKDSLSGLSNWLIWKTKMGIHLNLLSVTVERLYTMAVDNHKEEGVGAIMTRLERGIQGFIGAVSEIAFNVLPSLIYLFLSAFAMFKLDWRLSLLVLLFVPIPALIQSVVAPRQTAREKMLFKRWGKIYSRFNEVLSGIMTVRSFTMEHYEKKRFLHEVKEVNSTVIKGIGFDSGIGAVQSFVTVLARIAALALGGYLVLKGELSIGTVVAFLGYVSVLFGPVQGLTGIYKTVKTASVSLDHIFSIMDSQNILEDAPNASELKTTKGEVQFKDVSFSFKNSKQSVLKNINLHVLPGETVAIVGPSGAGKSTMMALLQRFYEVDKGAVLIDYKDVRSLQQMSLRKHIGVVQQDVLLFNDTIRNNIAYAKPYASDYEIVEAAKAANVHELILSLDHGYETIVGDRGGMLSMGERQRIAIARAILKDPPILILDEATSALDAEIEASVQGALNQLIKNRTTFIIAHRLATVVKASKIIVLKEGHITEIGNHRELLTRNGYYASLVEKQTKDLVLA